MVLAASAIAPNVSFFISLSPSTRPGINLARFLELSNIRANSLQVDDFLRERQTCYAFSWPESFCEGFFVKESDTDSHSLPIAATSSAFKINKLKWLANVGKGLDHVGKIY